MKKEKPASIDNLTVVFKEYLVQKLAEKKVGFNFLHPVIYQALVPVKACSSQMTLYDQFLTQASKCRLDRSMNTSEPNLADSEIFDVEKQQVRLILSMGFTSSFSKYFL